MRLFLIRQREVDWRCDGWESFQFYAHEGNLTVCAMLYFLSHTWFLVCLLHVVCCIWLETHHQYSCCNSNNLYEYNIIGVFISPIKNCISNIKSSHHDVNHLNYFWWLFWPISSTSCFYFLFVWRFYCWLINISGLVHLFDSVLQELLIEQVTCLVKSILSYYLSYHWRKLQALVFFPPDGWICGNTLLISNPIGKVGCLILL